MQSFADLAASRREWIDTVLKPWCRQASRRELLKAEADWANVAGQVAPEKTLWVWAWGRFPELVDEELASLNETREVIVTLSDERSFRGYPDARQSLQGELMLVSRDEAGGAMDVGPFSIDAVVAVTAS